MYGVLVYFKVVRFANVKLHYFADISTANVDIADLRPCDNDYDVVSFI